MVETSEAGGPVVEEKNSKGRNLFLLVGGLTLVLSAAMGTYFWKPRETSESQRERMAQNGQQNDRPGEPGKRFAKPRGEEVPQPEAINTGMNAAPASAPGKPGVEQTGQGMAPVAIVRRRPQPAGEAMLAAPKPPPPAAKEPSEPAAKQEGDGRPTTLAGLPVKQAVRIDDPSWYLFPGEYVMCRNEAPLTERTGAFWTAQIYEAKLNRGGTRELIPAGSKAFGKIAAGFNHGDRRLAAVITHIIGPETPGKPLLFIPIDTGQVGDDLGRVDMDGNVDNDFWRRLGSVGAYAALDALARGTTSYAGGAINRALNGANDGVNVNIGNFGGMGNGSSLAGAAYRQELNRQPSFSRPEAQPCSILITTPIDFRKALYIGK